MGVAVGAAAVGAGAVGDVVAAAEGDVVAAAVDVVAGAEECVDGVHTVGVHTVAAEVKSCTIVAVVVPDAAAEVAGVAVLTADAAV